MYPEAGPGAIHGAGEEGHPGWPARPGALRVGAGVVELRPIRLRDAGPWRRIRLADREYLRPWEPDAPGSWEQRHGLGGWLTQWWSLRSLARQGQCLPFAITVDGRFAGQLTIGNVVRSALRSAWVGYWVASAHASSGVATAAVALAVDHAFGPTALHRLEATVRPENAASIRVLTKVGFRREGLLLRYLSVAGAWRDHYCYAVTVEDLGIGAVADLIAGGRAERA
ncbi:GNAT family protein [Haloechinothrix sp. LS1_15]|uniref:GNAT family N-acetyltransferase n=1 Tax=Haloechinothrix sp. LS1_15 TaxID=2652248 RepID=UPI002947765A|nr:GNAT family protein [Haloechinothrix sp. LS1_15]MDV6014307.1 GNAT family N-acetyltransferase [Haloechinothrix sp. LS1_15]